MAAKSVSYDDETEQRINDFYEGKRLSSFGMAAEILINVGADTLDRSDTDPEAQELVEKWTERAWQRRQDVKASNIAKATAARMGTDTPAPRLSGSRPGTPAVKSERPAEKKQKKA